MRLKDAFRKECVCIGLDAADKPSVLRAVARCARNSSVLKDVDEKVILAALEQRESLGSTGFGEGIAIPHCRIPHASDFVVGLITIPDGAEFDSLDGEPVKLVVFIVGPDEDSNRHLRLLSAVSQVIHGEHVVREIVAARSVEAAQESFLRHTADELVVDGRHGGKRMVCVYVQDEHMFHEIIEVFVSMDACSTMVVPCENLQTYFGKVPLFQGLWVHEPGGFSRLIVSVVDKALTNELIRRIETRSGSLDKRCDMMVTIHDVLYTSGSLTT